METKKLSTDEKRLIFEAVRAKSDAFMTFAIFAYFVFGLFLAFFYDTYLIAFGVGGLGLAAYFVTKWLLPTSNAYQYVLAAVLAVFAAQFIYQMHGLFEMHFFVFVGSTLLITYQNWRLQLPLILLVVIHHAAFAYLQYSGNKEIYFTQLEYMDLQTFLFHGGLAAVIVAICGYWAFEMEKSTIAEALNKNALENQLETVTHNIAFAEEISSGNLGVEYQLKHGSDELGQALMKMRQNLAVASRKEQQEKFITVGITQIGDVIRKNANSVQSLADDFIRTLVKYMEMNQGGLFLLEGEKNEEHLNLASCYAFERKKYLNRKIAVGEGLVGQCFLERDIVYMTKVPQDYVQITSGLGGANPSCVILVPVMTSDEIVGVMELASFKPLEDFQIDFLKKAAENIASSIVSSRVTERVKALLSESQQQTEEMRAQEEEMRQNMEELQATQEEMRRKESHVRKVLEEEQVKADRVKEGRKLLLVLTKDKDVQAGRWNESLEKITQAISRFLQVSRASVWTYHPDKHAIFCEKLYQQSAQSFEAGTELFGRDFPGYFRAVLAEENIVAENAHVHPATSEFSDVYLKPLKIESMLDVPLFNQGKILGVICCEHQHNQKQWTEEDADFLRSCADLTTLVFKSKQLNDLTHAISSN
jgi:methyl-accepting chemotaxis protein